jgi:hypothetical protein
MALEKKTCPILKGLSRKMLEMLLMSLEACVLKSTITIKIIDDVGCWFAFTFTLILIQLFLILRHINY